MTAQIKAKAKELGANMVGICRLQPHMIDLGSEVSHEFVIACCVAEDYEKVTQGADAVEEEAMRTYAKCTEIATELAAYVRDMGYPAVHTTTVAAKFRRFRFSIKSASANSAATAV